MLTRRSLFAAFAGMLSSGASARSQCGFDPLRRGLPILPLKNVERLVDPPTVNLARFKELMVQRFGIDIGQKIMNGTATADEIITPASRTADT